MNAGTSFCRICLENKGNEVSLYLHVRQKYLPSVIESISGVVISSYDEPEALVCSDCSEALIDAERIIHKCQECHKYFKTNIEILSADHNDTICENAAKDENDDWNSTIAVQFKQEEEEIVNGEEIVETTEYDDNCFVEPELLVESILGNSLQGTVDAPANQSRKEKRAYKKRGRKKKLKDIHDAEEIEGDLEQNTAASLYQSHFKMSKPKKAFIRSREQYIKRKIRNYPVKEPLKLIGGAGIVRKRKPKSYHRAIPNFYFRCELCHEFESNVASYAVNHLTSVHGIERPAIFRCSQCNAKPFIKNQSLQEHIATIHEQQPKKRDFVCSQCGKTFIKNCHLQKHLLSVHKIGEMPYKCNIFNCGKEYVEGYALRAHMKQVHRLESEAELQASTKETPCKFEPFDDLAAHVRTSQTADGYNCLYCGYRFNKKSRCETHMRTAGCKPPCFVCRYCEKSFAKLVQLEEHQKQNH